jgi:hypothetical protein
MNITKLRTYRINLERNFLNDKSDGIALFDLIGTFLVAYILNMYFGINNKILYYLLVLPIAVVSHLLVGKSTYLNRHLFCKSINIYQILFIILIVCTLNNV